MKKYKCINKYPFGVAVGRELFDSWEGKDSSLANFPEFWEEIIDEDYKIISYCNIFDPEITSPVKNDLCRQILSVERFSDNKVFSIGDTFYLSGNTFNKYIIDELFLDENYKVIVCASGEEGCYSLNTLKKVDSVTFKTEDGVELTEKDEFWVVTQEKCNLVGNRSHTYPDFSKDKSKYLRFSSLEEANKYRVLNKDCLSLQDVFNTVNLSLRSGNNLKEIIQKRIL